MLKEYLESANILSRNALENKKTQKIFDNWQLLQSISVCRCLELMCCDNLGKMEASARVAEIMYGKRGQKSYKAETIRKWITHYQEYGTMKTYEQGKHVKTFSIITDENFQLHLKTTLRNMSDLERTPESFRNKLNNEILQQFENAPTSICLDTARKWMRFLNFNPTEAIKGWFTDGHEREDVILDREAFLRLVCVN